MLGYLGLSLFVLLLIFYLSPFFYPFLSGFLGALAGLNALLLLGLVIRDRVIQYRKEDRNDYRKY